MSNDFEYEISEALNAHLAGMTGAWEIAYENVQPENLDDKHIRVQTIRGPTETPNLDRSGFRYFGTYRLTLVDRINEGVRDMLSQAGLIRQRFAYLTRLTTPVGTVQIYQEPQVLGGFHDPPDYLIPVDVSYQLITE